jgi:FtsZ-interacting cell division protein ZipA
MSDLQIGLLILGVLVIGGVVAFNWFQEKRFRQRGEHGFKRPEADVLLGGAEPRGHAADEQWEPRIEPQVEPRLDTTPPLDAEQDESVELPPKSEFSAGSQASPAPQTSPVPQAPPAPQASPVSQASPAPQTPAPAAARRAESITQSLPDASISYVSEIRSGEVIPASVLSSLETELQQSGCKFQLFGYDYHKQSWEPVSDAENWYTSVKVFIQLVDRGGSVTAQQVESIDMSMRKHANEVSGICEAPSTDEVLTKALSLEDFCLEVDIIVGLSVAARPGQVLHGTQLRALAESSGLILSANGVFVMPDEHGGALFTMDNQESKPFRLDELKSLTTRGVTFLLDVPRTANGVKVLNKMIVICKQFADSLDAMLCDDNRTMLNDTGLEKIRTQLRLTYEMMDKRGIPAGSGTARQLFS